MNFKLKVENTAKRFRVRVILGEAEVYECGWQGGEFEHEGKWYAVMGPYNGLDGDRFRLYELVPATEPV